MTKTTKEKRAGRSLKRMVRRPYKYIHTIGGRPAHYYPGEQVCYAMRCRPIPTVETLEQIRKEQKASEQWRRSKGMMPTEAQYGWMKVAV